MAQRMRIDDEQRRARLVQRHHLARTAPDVVSAVRAVMAQHSSDPTTPHLALWARVPDFQTADLDAAMYDRQDLLRVHAMRRTMFVVPREDLAAFDAGAGRAVAAAERKKLEGWLAADMPAKKIKSWLASLEAEVVAAVTASPDLRTQDLSAQIPALETQVLIGSGKWTQHVPVSSRLVFLLALEGRIARSRPAGSWRSSQYRWVPAPAYEPIDPATGRIALARRYIATHGPVTSNDLKWWMGWTVKDTKAALAALDLTPVALSHGEGFVLAGDTHDVEAPSHVSLLPGLDSTAMGWFERDWYLGPHRAPLFDNNGNAGPTIWHAGRVVGAWAQRADGRIVTQLLEDLGKRATSRVAAEADALTTWLGGVVSVPRFPTPLYKALMA